MKASREFSQFLARFELHLSSIFYLAKRAQRLTFWVRRPPGGVGVFLAKGWWPKTSSSPLKFCLPWVSKREKGIWDVPGILPGCPGPLGVFKKFVLKMLVRIYRSLCPCDDPRIVPGTNRICPWDKPNLSQGQTQVFS